MRPNRGLRRSALTGALELCGLHRAPPAAAPAPPAVYQARRLTGAFGWGVIGCGGPSTGELRMVDSCDGM